MRDPNPALQGAGTQNDIPVFETREFDSILRLQSGEIAVLAGLMQDFAQTGDSGIPGIRSIPIIGEALSSRADLLPKPYLDALSRLQDKIKPFPYAEVEP